MATRLKTVEYAFPVLAALVDNTLTSLTQITVSLPETGTKTFRSVVATVNAQQTGTATGNVTTRQAQLRLGAAGYTAHTNSNLYTGSGEDIHAFHAVDLTSHFTTNWTGTSMTLDCQVLFDGTATGVAWTNVCCTVLITYEYDDTATTQIKTIRIPLNMPVGSLANAKPAALASIPNLSTELPESSKVFRSTYIVVQGNLSLNASAADTTMTFQLDATASHTTGVFEGVSASDMYFRYVWDISAVLNTSAAMDWFAWASVITRLNHLQAYLVVTYEFDASASTGVFVSVMLPMDVASPMGTSATAYQRAIRTLNIQEPGTITTKQIAFFPFWEQATALSALNMRIGTGSFVTYTDIASNLSGSNAAMIRNDSAVTLARGRNYLNADFHTSGAAAFGFCLSGFWIVNYTCSTKPTGGYGAANHTVLWNLGATFNGAAVVQLNLTAIAPVIPETDYYVTALGTEVGIITNTTNGFTGLSFLVERLTGEGEIAGIEWETVSLDIGMSDPETGLHLIYSQIKDLFKRWNGDPDTDRMPLETARRWRLVYGNGIAAWANITLMLTYHTITSTFAGVVSNYADADGAGLTVDLHRTSNGEKILSTTTTAGGVYSFKWMYNTDEVFAKCYENATHVGMSAPGYAVLD